MRPGSLSAGIRTALQTVYLPFTVASTPSETLCIIARTRGHSSARRPDLTTPATSRQPIRLSTLAAVLVLAATFVALLIAATPAAAAESCGRQVIDDWYDDGRVDGTYALHCYDDAIEILPRDVRDYSSAKEDIERALQAKLRGEPAPPATTDPSPDDESPGPGTTPGSTPGSDPPGGTPTGGTDGSEATLPLGDSASSVPVPLLILAGLALLLVAGGSAGYVIRRLQSRRIPPPVV